MTDMQWTINMPTALNQ